MNTNNTQLISIYCSAFNLIKNKFNWKESLDNFVDFADEVVVCVNKSEDSTLETLHKYKNDNGLDILNIVESNFSYDDLAFDGKIKNEALKNTKYPGKVLLDLDEFIPLSQFDLWRECVSVLYSTKQLDALLIPSINLCGGYDTYKDIGYKFYLHKNHISRGVVKNAKLSNGKIDTSISDTTEPINSDGSLASSLAFSNNIDAIKSGDIPYVFHKWCVNYEDRIRQNSTWKPVWENRSGKEEQNIILSEEKLKNIPIFHHNLPTK